MHKIDVNVKTEDGTLVIRTGEALKISYPIPTVQSGVSFESLVAFVKTGLEYDKFKKEESLAIVDFEKGEVTFKSKYSNEFTDVISASLELSKFLQRFKINNLEGFPRKKFADLIKFNRRFIELPNWEELFTATKNISVNQVTNITIQDKNNKGSQKHNFEQENSFTYPESIRLNIPVFKNQENKYQVIEVDTQIDVVNGDLNFCLVSPQLEELIEITKEEVLTECIKNLEELGIITLKV